MYNTVRCWGAGGGGGGGVELCWWEGIGLKVMSGTKVNPREKPV